MGLKRWNFLIVSERECRLERCSFFGYISYFISNCKIQWLQDPNQSNVDNLNNVRCEASRHFRNKKREYLKARINEFETNAKNKNIRDMYNSISNFKKGKN
jgi:hypothetical protein